MMLLMIYTWKIPSFRNGSNVKAFQSFTDSLETLVQLSYRFSYHWVIPNTSKLIKVNPTKDKTQKRIQTLHQIWIHFTNYKREAILRRPLRVQVEREIKEIIARWSAGFFLFFFFTCNAWTTPEANYRENSVVTFLVFRLLIVELRSSIKKPWSN